MSTHGEKRLGLLTSSTAGIIVHGSEKAWRTLSKKLWLETAADFDHGMRVASLDFGHAHEAQGAALFWELHPDVRRMTEDAFFSRTIDGVPLGSSPDRVLIGENESPFAGLEVKSAMTLDALDNHTLRQHYDQCQHGMLVSGLPRWYLGVHCQGQITIDEVGPDLKWQLDYLKRAAAFWRLHNTGRIE